MAVAVIVAMDHSVQLLRCPQPRMMELLDYLLHIYECTIISAYYLSTYKYNYHVYINMSELKTLTLGKWVELHTTFPQRCSNSKS